MRKRMLCVLCAAMLLLTTACGKTQQSDSGKKEARLTVLATTYPVYLLTQAVTEDMDDVEVLRLNTGNISCLHDYTLSVNDMKLIEAADVIAINGVGLESFMEDALASSQAAVIDTSEGAQLLESLGHHHEEGDDHDHGHFDPHIWLDPANASIMVHNLAEGLSQQDPDRAADYAENAAQAQTLIAAQADAMKENVAACPVQNIGLVTFHDGFQYFAKAFGFELLAAIEEEAGSEASAKEINEITGLVNDKHIPVIFTEKNGSDATAQAIARETGCAVGQLDMLMSGEGTGLSAYFDGLNGNIQAVVGGFTGTQG